MKMAQLPIAPVTRLVRNAGAERVSEDASEALAVVIEEYGENIARKAVSLAKHAGRKTVKKEDIVEACGPLRGVERGGAGLLGPLRRVERGGAGPGPLRGVDKK